MKKRYSGRQNQNARTVRSQVLIARAMVAVLASVPLVITLLVRSKSNTVKVKENTITVMPITADVEPAVIEEVWYEAEVQTAPSSESQNHQTSLDVSTTLEEVDSQVWSKRIGAKYQVSKNDFVQLCNLVGREYGSDFVPEKEKALVCLTVLNRVESEHFPDTIEAVISQPGQYEGELSRGYYSDKVTESVREAVMMTLNGEIEPNDYIFYWGDGRTNHFYPYEEYNLFAADLNAFKTSKTASE